MKPRELENLGLPRDLARLTAPTLGALRAQGMSRDDLRARIESIVRDPASFEQDETLGEVARGLVARAARGGRAATSLRTEPVSWRRWGSDIEPEALAQMAVAAKLPVAVAGALMPDAHLGYGLPIGGVLATEGAVVPYAVGVDIACRMKLSVLDLPVAWIAGQRDRLVHAIESETRFGAGAEFGRRGDGSSGRLREHAVLDEDWSATPVTERVRDRARRQLGTSGSGNHFVEFGVLTVDAAEATSLGLRDGGEYLALLSHSGSRGAGALVCDHYSKLAQSMHPDLPREAARLAWLPLDGQEGQEYWAAMELMGRYAAANHDCIHRHIVRHLGAEVLLDIENHHNFAWKERHLVDGVEREVVVHRKGATPAGAGVLGVIPGSMASPGFVVRGKGDPASLSSASHGAGRRMSRTRARESHRWGEVRRHLDALGVHVVSAGLDEVPFAYKDIASVMAAQQDLVEVVARFDPRIVKMAPDGEPPED
jgi:tRNA-splicing ligase RtcB